MKYSIGFSLLFVTYMAWTTVNLSADKSDQVLYDYTYDTFESQSIEELADSLNADIVYRFYIFDEERNPTLYTVVIHPQRGIPEESQDIYYSANLDENTKVTVKLSDNKILSEKEIEWDRKTFLSFLSLLGSTEIFSLPEKHAVYEPRPGWGQTGGNSYVLYERFYWGEVNRVFRLTTEDSSTATTVKNWLVRKLG